MVGNASSTTQAAVTVQHAANETGADYLQPNGTFSDAFAGILADGNSPGTVIDVAVAPTPVPTPAPTSNEGSGTNHGLIGGVIGGLVVAAGLVAFAVKRRHNAASKTPTVQTSYTNDQGQKAVVLVESGPLLI
tara:strand:- start:1822 stop:2220 length:399 start_codon:yes stop_codon:yes gene_type:complete